MCFYDFSNYPPAIKKNKKTPPPKKDKEYLLDRFS